MINFVITQKINFKEFMNSSENRQDYDIMFSLFIQILLIKNQIKDCEPLFASLDLN